MTQPQEAAAEDALAETVSIDEALAEEAVAESVVSEEPLFESVVSDEALAESVVSDEALSDEALSDPGLAEAVSTGDAATGSLDLTDPAALRSALEALLFVADAPVQLGQLAAAVQRPAAEVAQALAEITADLDGRDAGWQLRPAATGFRLYTRDRYAPVVEAFLLDGQRASSARPPWRRWPWWPTGSRSPGPGSRPSAASTSTGWCAPCWPGN